MSVPLAFLISSDAALAHGKHDASDPHAAPIQGTVTSLSGNALQVQTQTGNVSVPLTSTTHVIRQVTGSAADLTDKAHVDLELAKDTTTVTAILIDDTVHPHHSQPTSKPRPSGKPAPHDRSVHTGTGTPRAVPHGAPNHVSGQIVSVKGNTITVRAQHGQSAAYTLGSSVTITKLMNGTTTDLAIRETVRVFQGRGGTDTTILILSA